MEVSAILLGAGESRRMGENKLLLPWEGKTVLEHCLDELLGSNVLEVILVLSNLDRWAKERFDGKRIKLVVNPLFKEGMSTSIKIGVRSISPRARGIMIALGDQPFVHRRTINRLIRAFRSARGSIVVPSFRGIKGHPVIFDRIYERDLLCLKGDAGGRSVIEKYRSEVRIVPVRSEGVIKDIDTWSDYRRELRSRGIHRRI